MLRFRLFGIPFEIGPYFWVGSAMFGANVAQGANAVTALLVWIACVFVSIIVHELGHALTARHFGAQPAVELHALGGVTRMFGRGLTRSEGFWVTLAGPAAGFGLYLVTLGIRHWPGLTHTLADSGETVAFVVVSALSFLWQINLFWTLFNLMPILPLDGGRLLSALLGPQRFNTTQGVGVFFAGSLATLAALYGEIFMAIFLGYLAYVNFRGTPRAVPGGVSQ